MDIKKLEGSLSFEDFDEGLVSYGNCKTFGEVWEKCVNCNYCDHKAACEALQDEVYKITCAQVIDFLLGQKTLAQITSEVDKR